MFKVLDEICKPKRGSKYSAYIDLFAREDVTISVGGTILVPLGVKINITNNWIREHLDKGFFNPRAEERKDWFLKSHYLEVVIEKSLALQGLLIPNGINIISLDCPDEINILVHKPYSERTVRETIMMQKVQENSGDFERYNIESHFNTHFIEMGSKVAQCTIKEHKGYLLM